MPAENPADAERRHERNNIRQMVELSVHKAMDERDDKLTAYIDLKFNELKDTLLSGFPEHDAEGHRAYHIEQIEFMKERRALWKAIREKTVVGIVWMVVVLLGTALLDYAKRKLLVP